MRKKLLLRLKISVFNIMTTICKRGRGLNGVTLVADCSGKKKKSCSGKSSGKKLGCGGAFSNVYFRINDFAAPKSWGVNIGSGNPIELSSDTADVVGARNCGFLYSAPDISNGPHVICKYAGNYEINFDIQLTSADENYVYVFGVYVNEVLVETLQGNIYMLQLQLASAPIGVLSLNGILRLKANDKICIKAFLAEPGTPPKRYDGPSIFNFVTIGQFNLTIASLP